MKSAALAVKFGLEVAALASFAYWGATLPGAVLSASLAIAAPLATAWLWGVLAAPRSTRRLPDPASCQMANEVHDIGVNWPHHIFVDRKLEVVGSN
jgi:hypothetical protein